MADVWRLIGAIWVVFTSLQSIFGINQFLLDVQNSAFGLQSLYIGALGGMTGAQNEVLQAAAILVLALSGSFVAAVLMDRQNLRTHPVYVVWSAFSIIFLNSRVLRTFKFMSVTGTPVGVLIWVLVNLIAAAAFVAMIALGIICLLGASVAAAIVTIPLSAIISRSFQVFFMVPIICFFGLQVAAVPI